MKTRLLVTLLGASALALPAFSSGAVAQESTTNAYMKTWGGVATLRKLSKSTQTLTMKAAYPVFSGSRPVAQVAGLVLKQEAVRGFDGFAKGSRGTAKDLGLRDGMKYEYLFEPSLVLSRPRLISATTMVYLFTGGAHGNYGTSGYVFGYPQGANRPRQLKLADFFTDGNVASKRVNDLLMAKLRATKGKEQEAMWVLEGEVKWVPVALRENFVVEADGLRWFFPPYAVGPFANGEYEVKLSPRELGPQFRAGMLQ